VVAPLVDTHFEGSIHKLEFYPFFNCVVGMSPNVVLERAKKFHRQPAVSRSLDFRISDYSMCLFP
jgi:hypothetical protein